MLGLAAAALLAASAPASVQAYGSKFTELPNGSVVLGKMSSPCLLCHTLAMPGTCVDSGQPRPCLNANFGTLFRDMAGWKPALAAMDLDGDGFTNGQELQDPAGTWVAGMTAGVAAYVTLPYDAADHPGLHDDDHDGVCWFGRDGDGDHQCVGPNEKTTDRDCDDGNTSRHTGADELCDGADQDCDGLSDEGLVACDPGAGDCPAGQGENKQGDCLAREQIDGDRDGTCHAGVDLSMPADWDCVDEGEQTTARDCNEFDAEVSPALAEACIDGKDNDCDQQIDAADTDCTDYVDGDQDGFCPAGQDLDADRQCDTQPETQAETGLHDCDDGDAVINPNGTEACTNAKDDDCDGVQDGRDEACGDYRDLDRDGYCKAGRDRDGDFLCDGRNEQGDTNDCDDGLPDVHVGAIENCIDEKDNDCDDETDEAGSCTGDEDADEDGYCALGHDLNRDGDCADRNEDEAVSDCNDADDDTHPTAEETCTDNVDNDCDGLTDLADENCGRLLDDDGDRYCPAGHDINSDGDCLDFDEERPIVDCDDSDPDVRPRAGENCSDGVDNDCNDEVDGFDGACLCEEDEQCPVSMPCMLGRCMEGIGCAVVPDPTCGEPEDDDAGLTDGGLINVSDAGDAGPERDAGKDDGGQAEEDPSAEQPVLEDVGCGCTIVGAHERSAAPWLLLGSALFALRRLRRRQSS